MAPDDSLGIDIHRSEATIQPTVDAFETAGSFTLVLRNHGPTTRIHLRPKGPLATVVRVDDQNPLIEGGDERTIPVSIEGPLPKRTDGERSIEGGLTVSLGYGRVRECVGVRVFERAAGPTVARDLEGRTIGSRTMLVGAAIGAGLIAVVAHAVGWAPEVLLAVVGGIVGARLTG